MPHEALIVWMALDSRTKIRAPITCPENRLEGAVSIPELQAFHLGIVVRDLDETMRQYAAMLGVGRWHRRMGRFNGLEMAYGRGGGQTFELFQVTGPGDSHIHQFFEQHGEGVNHIGFWTPDMPSSVRTAIDTGAELVSLTADAEGKATAVFIPAANVTPEDFEQFGMVTFVNPTGGVLIEYVGQVGEKSLRDWFKEDFANVVISPSWSS